MSTEGHPLRGVIGERLKEDLTPDVRASEFEMWSAILPPPRQGNVDEDDVLMWIRECAKAGEEHADESKGISAINAVQFVHRPDIFPHGNVLRGQCQHLFGSLLRELDDENKRRREALAQAKARDSHDALRDLKRSKGWL